MNTIGTNGAPSLDIPPQGAYWMRSISFTGLHRILSAVGNNPQGLTAKEINDLVLTRGLALTPHKSRPAPTTLYHYRNTLLRLRILIRTGRTLHANIDDPDVRELLLLPPPNGHQPLQAAACDRFAALVLRNDHCRSSFFDLFMPPRTVSISTADFRHNSTSVRWWHHQVSGGTSEVVFLNEVTGRIVRYASRMSKTAIMYGLRYWARDLRLIDEYCPPGGATTTMFPLSESASVLTSSVMAIVRYILSVRSSDEWTMFSIHDLIRRYCERERKSRATLFAAIDWLLREWPHHTALIPTSPALSSIDATSSYRKDFTLRRQYRQKAGPYISHIRVHKDVSYQRRSPYYVQHTSEVRA